MAETEQERKERLRKNLNRAGMGRPKGAKNKVTKTVKQALEESLNSGDGAVKFFTKLREDDPKTYTSVVAKLIPHQINAEHNHTGEVKINLVPMKVDEDSKDESE